MLTGDVHDQTPIKVLVENGDVISKTYKRGELVERWMDVGVIDHVSEPLM